MFRSGLLCGAAIVLVSAAGAGGAGAKERFTTFDPTGSVYTYAAAINTSGAVGGYYDDSRGMAHGFVRAPDGTITAFDPTGSTSTEVTSINDNGDVAGWYRTASGTYVNFVRASDGTITTFNATKGNEPVTIGLNAKGKVAGWYLTGDYAIAGFVGMPEQRIKQLTVEGVAINTRGAVTGIDGSEGFVRAPSGQMTTFTGPNNPSTTVPTGINDSGVVAGYGASVCGIEAHGFSRDASGKMTAIDAPDAEYTRVTAINDKGALAGSYYYGGYHGFVRSPDGTYKTFDVAGATNGTYPEGINANREVAGGYYDANDRLHGFVGTP
ncbi:MAG TPA: hypothetical protein VKR31_14395 [Rhizomicrobium sp.]|nr:hypothetical protein [Rhizomicrobium sp.]